MDRNSERSYLPPYTVTTLLAAIFNVIALLVICFGVMPRLEAIDARIQDAIEKNNERITKMNVLIEDASKRADAVSQKLKQSEKKDKP